MILDKLDKISEALVKLDEKIGFRRLCWYALLVFVAYCVFNFKNVTKGVIEFVQEINEELHTEKMERRDELLRELLPVLLEFRTHVGADRVLYFEYHNSKENLVGIPFKYIDLILQNTKYGVPSVFETDFRDINVGSITPLYEATKTGSVIVCKGPEDYTFQKIYPGTYELFTTNDSSKIQAFISIPGINQPVGMIVLEWMDEVDPAIIDNLDNIVFDKNNNYISRINGLIMSKR